MRGLVERLLTFDLLPLNDIAMAKLTEHPDRSEAAAGRQDAGVGDRCLPRSIRVAVVRSSETHACADCVEALLNEVPGFSCRHFAGTCARGLDPVATGERDNFDPDIVVVTVETAAPAYVGALFDRVHGVFPQREMLVIPTNLESAEVCELLRMGASDFLLTPLRRPELISRIIHRVLASRRGDAIVAGLKADIGLRHIIGESPAFVRALRDLPRIARCQASVLICGESGTGKEVFARAIHYSSARTGQPFVPVNCGAIPEPLVESEIFGHKRGAFTGAVADRPGLIREAEGGTLLLDEIDALSCASQVKLLRFLQESEYRPVGSQQIVHADVRVIAAANGDFERLVSEGKFRRDLFYRLNVLRLELPPLRARREDVPLLAAHFLEHQAALARMPAKTLSSAALARLLAHSWPGNVRELENVLTRAFLLTDGEVIEAADLALPGGADPAGSHSFHSLKARAVRDFERDYLETVLRTHQGNITRAAHAANKNRRAFWELLRKHGLHHRGS